MKTFRVLAAAIVMATCLHPAAEAQTWPDGCSIPGGTEWQRRGLDALFLGACTVHDYCWALCNGQNPPYHNEVLMFSCNALFYEHMIQACNLRADQPYPVDDIDDRNEFLTVCQGLARVLVAGVTNPIAEENFWRSQCTRGCNPDACNRIGWILPYTCGTGSGPGQCYLSDGSGGSGGGSGGGGSGGGGGGSDWCDADGDGWVTESECIFDCDGYVEDGYCNL